MYLKGPNERQLPIIPLPSGQVLLSGVTKRISIIDRPDIIALLRKVYGTTTEEFLANSHLAIGCVPLNPPAPVQFYSDRKDQQNEENGLGKTADKSAVTPDEKNGDNTSSTVISAFVTPDPSDVRASDLYTHGVMARIILIEEKAGGSANILVEGLSRFRMVEIKQEKPYVEASVELIADEGQLEILFHFSYSDCAYVA